MNEQDFGDGQQINKLTRGIGEEKNKNTGVIIVFCFAPYNFNQWY